MNSERFKENIQLEDYTPKGVVSGGATMHYFF